LETNLPRSIKLTMEATTERRKNTRHALCCCVSFFRKSSHPVAEGVTRDLSSAGFYCRSPMPLTVGESLTCLLRIPSPYRGRSHTLTLECTVRVVRLEQVGDEGSFGIGCQLEGYHSCSRDQEDHKACVI